MSEDRRLSGLYREGAREEPPPHLDAAIRAAARREAGARPRASTWSPFPSGWRLPLAVAAMLVIATTTVTLVMEERGEKLHLAEQRAAPPTAPTVASPAAPAVAPATAPPLAAETAGPALEPKKQAPPPVADRVPAAPPKLAERGGNFVPEPPAPVSAESERQSARQSAAGTAAGARPESVVQPQPAAPAAPAKDEFATIPPAAAPAQSADADARSPSAGSAAAGPALAPDMPARLRVDRDAVRELHIPAEAKRAPPDPLAAARDAQPETPVKWLERIEELRKQGKLEEAAKSLAEFRKRYPDYPLPPHLKDGIKP